MRFSIAERLPVSPLLFEEDDLALFDEDEEEDAPLLPLRLEEGGMISPQQPPTWSMIDPRSSLSTLIRCPVSHHSGPMLASLLPINVPKRCVKFGFLAQIYSG